ncbi:glycoside hydrolase family 9 protein [Flaviaesturariibacter amylovorans]|uniref:Endoglucanase n=1 Tax=Flaviaesturariibacter amylovorans TaxID=1084520 RepID=A0ABP8H0I3_9BACT
MTATRFCYALIPFLLLWGAAACTAQPAGTRKASVYLNQEGFAPAFPKTAIVTGAAAGPFYILVERGDTAFRGTLSREYLSTNSSLVTRRADFTALQRPGTYVLVLGGGERSMPFRIAPDPLRNASVSLLKGFYFQRSGTALDAAFAGAWARPAGHPDTAALVHASAARPGLPAGSRWRAPGGWYDAGDYNKYIVNSGVTMGTLLSAYEDFPAYFDTLRTGIPESGNSLPDILDEALWNLRWMMAMQDPADGGVFHKLTNPEFNGMVLPHIGSEPRYVVRKSTAATLDLAATCAQAARVFEKFGTELPGLADSCRRIALNAWQWAGAHPAERYQQEELNKRFDPDINTGGYGDADLRDEQLWAASELFITTRDTSYLPVIRRELATGMRIPSWAQVGFLGYMTLVRHQALLPEDLRPLYRQIVDSVTLLGARLLEGRNTGAFATPMGHQRKDFAWGSNAVAANQGIVLLYAATVSGNPEFRHAALDNADYLLGRNATGYCFITGIGHHSPLHPHHRPSEGDGVTAPVPGLLVGGPNPGRQDQAKYPFTEPEQAYVDAEPAYAANEIAINWNAPAVYLLHALRAWSLQKGFRMAPQTPKRILNEKPAPRP